MFKQILIYLLISVGLTTTVFASEPVDEKKLAIEVNEFIDMMVDEHAFDKRGKDGEWLYEVQKKYGEYNKDQDQECDDKECHTY